MTEHFSFIYSQRFGDGRYGEAHPFKVERYLLCRDLIAALGLLDRADVRTIDAPQPRNEELLTFHHPDYLECLRQFSDSDRPRADFRYGLGDVENPVFPGLFEWASLACGGTLEAARQVVDGGCRSAFNIAGGWHHAHTARASGFSYLNDAVLAIHWLLQQGLKVAYVDIDAHHGDGVQEAFYASDQVLTVSVHETGDDFFPHTGYARELGQEAGYGWTVNIPLLRHADDRLFRRAFDEVVLPALAAFRPDILVTQMGVDSLRSDPLARLEMTTHAIEHAARGFRATGIPWIVLGGGGYTRVNVARCWALVWAIVVAAEVPDLLPDPFCHELLEQGGRIRRLRDLPHQALPDDYARASAALDRELCYLHQHLPWLGARAVSGRP